MNFILAFLLFVCSSAFAQKPGSTIDKVALPLIESFFKTVNLNQSREAVINIFSTNPSFNTEDSSILNVVQQMEYVASISGAFLGKNLLKKREIEDALIVYVYLAKYEKRFYRFLFTFYNNSKVVRLYQFSLDEEMLEEIKGSLKFYD